MTTEIPGGKPCEVCPAPKRDLCWKSPIIGCPTWAAWIKMVNQLTRVKALPETWRRYVASYTPAARSLGEMAIEGEVGGVEKCIQELEKALGDARSQLHPPFKATSDAD